MIIELPDGARLSVTIQGKGPPLLLVSGLGGTAGFWQPLLPEIAHHHRVAVMDQRGIGASTRGTAPVTIRSLAQDAAAVATAMGGAPPVPLALCGHSTGAAIVLTMTAERMCPVSRIVVSAGWLRPDAYLRALFEMRLAILERAGLTAYEQAGRFLAYPPEILIAEGSSPRPACCHRSVRLPNAYAGRSGSARCSGSTERRWRGVWQPPRSCSARQMT